MRENKLTFIIKNNTNQQIQMPLFTNGQDNNANATRCFYYDVSTATFDGTGSSVQVKGNDNDDYITYDLGILSNMTELIEALNELGFGTWYKVGNQLIICNDNLEFGELQINTTNTTSFEYTTTPGSAQTQFDILFNSITPFSVDWGDGNTDNYSGTNSYTPNHTYSVPGVSYTVTVTMLVANISKITRLRLSHFGECLTIGDLNELTNCTQFDANYGGNPSSLSSLPALPPNLGGLSFGNTQVSSFPSLPSTLVDINANGNQLTSLPAMPVGILNLYAATNQLSTTFVSNALIELDANGLFPGLINLAAQTPAAPPNAGGTTAKNNLISKGWTVTTD